MSTLKKLLLTIGFSCFCLMLYGQISIGHYYDVNGTRFTEFYEPFFYEPKVSAEINYYVNEFIGGIIYRTDGSTVMGLVKIDNSRILYKKDFTDEFSEVFTQAFVKGAIINRDSFFVAQNFNVEKRTGPIFRDRREFMEFIYQTEELIFAQHYDFTERTMNQMTDLPRTPVLSTFQVKRRGA